MRRAPLLLAALPLVLAACGEPTYDKPVQELVGSTMGTTFSVKIVDPPTNLDLVALQDEVQAALPVCGPIIAGASFLPNSGEGMTTETQDQFLAFAQCLRDEGVDVSDPDLSNGAAGLLDWEFDPEDPANAAAIEAWQSLFAGAGGG